MKKLPNWIAVALKGAGILHFFLAAGLIFFSDTILAILEQGDVLSAGSVLWLRLAGIGFAILGLGYLIASFNTLRNSVALFMGIAAMLSGFLFLPFHFGLAVLTNGLLASAMAFMCFWAGFLVWILYGISKARHLSARLSYSYTEPLAKTLSRFRTQRGKNLLQLSNEQPVLVIFLHRFQNSLCRQLLLDIIKKQASIQDKGTRLVFVHLGSETKAAGFLENTALKDEHRISDPNGILYQAFELEKAAYEQAGNWRTRLSQWVPGIRNGLGASAIMPGAFLIIRGKVVKSYRHGDSAENPDFLSLASFEAA